MADFASEDPPVPYPPPYSTASIDALYNTVLREGFFNFKLARSPSTQKKSITFSTHSRQKIKMTNRGAWIPIGVAIGVAISVATKDPTWIAVGVALGAGLGFTRPQKDCRPDKED